MEKREEEFLTLVKKIKDEDNSENPYNCLVPWSGGKDSTFIALKLKFEFSLRPLLITFAPLIPNNIGQYNREALIKKDLTHYILDPTKK